MIADAWHVAYQILVAVVGVAMALVVCVLAAVVIVSVFEFIERVRVTLKEPR